MYHRLHVRCPHLAIQPFICGLCDLHGICEQIPFTSHRSQQFSDCYDLYLDIQRGVRHRVDTVLQRGPDWRVKNACPACTYKLKDELPMRFSMLIAMDGNDSLKRIMEYITKLNFPGTEGFKEPREEVDKWDISCSTNTMFDEEPNTPSNACATRWRNMSTEHTSKMWGVFDESGIFIALCRHGFVLAATDMVRSGEKAKYPLSIVNRLLDNFGKQLGVGYDIGCRFRTIVNNSALGPRAKQLQYQSLVGAFHGHAHNRLCQLSNLTTYVDGLGLEDLEGCERFFAKSNSLASSTQYSSVFHRHQRISEYMRAVDTFDTYASLSTCNVKSYFSREPALHELMKALKYQESVFPTWLDEERTYLQSLSTEPLQETLEMEYYSRLVELNVVENALHGAQQQWFNSTPQLLSIGTSTHETKRRHLLEKRENVLNTVQQLEIKLNIHRQWTPDFPKWDCAKQMVEKREYQRCLDRLVVQRIFEMTKMNMSQIGYNLRNHIAQALQTRSNAIRTAVDNYNIVAKSFKRPELKWEDVVAYAFLSEFDLLQDSRSDVRTKPWASPAARQLLDQYFKIRCACEEITRLNIEIRRVVTYMKDEKHFLIHMQQKLAETQPHLAHQIRLYRDERGRFNKVHIKRFVKLALQPAFTGTVKAGESLRNISGGLSFCPQALADDGYSEEYGDDRDSDDDDDDDDDDEEDRLRTGFDLLDISSD
ncbi:hypothetical protein F5887DRAFT_1062040 [Amanita rubescens]|nr:hypothetical protein F5887DRAFT_1062040 [Amanita rubescens]